MSRKQIYLDHNATTPVDPRVLKAMLPYFTEEFGNAASVDHDFGSRAKAAVDKAREQIAKAINAFPDEIIFTSGATESDNIALFGVAERYAAKGKHIITCVTEHKAILDCCKHLEKQGFRITYLSVDEYGTVNLQELEAAITPETILVSIMAANNEIGTLAPLTEIGEITRKHGVLFHTDAAQALGQVPLDVQASNIDILSMSAHKVYGPKGVGALYRRSSNPRVNLTPVIFGGGHERGLRSGTLNVPGIVGFGKAVELVKKEADDINRRYREWAQCLLVSLQEQGLEISLNGHPQKRLPNNVNFSVKGLESRALIVQLKDVAISTGSACTTTLSEPSHVIMALGFGEERAHSAIRIGFGRFNTNEEITEATNKIVASVNRLKAFRI